jgi:hypothetical protein
MNTFSRMIKVFVIAVALLIAIPALTACSPEVSPNPEKLAAIADTIQPTDVQSCRAKWSGSSISNGVTTESAQEAAFAAPDNYHVKINDDGAESEFITTGNTQYVKGSEISPVMMTALAQSTYTFLNIEYCLNALDLLVEPEPLRLEKINGIECFHYKGTVDLESQWEKMISESLDPSQPDYEDRLKMLEGELETIRETTIEYEIWIGRDDLLVRQMKYTGRMPSEDKATWDTSDTTIQLYDINQPVVVEPPLDAQGELLPGWQLAGNYIPAIDFTKTLEYEITGDDPAQQQVSLVFTITNTGIETASDVIVNFERIVTPEDKEDEQWIEAISSVSGPVELAPGASETFIGGYECDTTRVAPEKFEELVKMTTVRITYNTPAGHEQVKTIYGDAPHPTAVPPPEPTANR